MAKRIVNLKVRVVAHVTYPVEVETITEAAAFPTAESKFYHFEEAEVLKYVANNPAMVDVEMEVMGEG